MMLRLLVQRPHTESPWFAGFQAILTDHSYSPYDWKAHQATRPEVALIRCLEKIDLARRVGRYSIEINPVNVKETREK
jgi:hypothetical protein